MDSNLLDVVNINCHLECIQVIKTLLFLATIGQTQAFEIAGTTIQPEPRRSAEALCGPEIVLIGDAWEHVQIERDEMIELVKNGDLVIVPQKIAALRSHLAFIRNRAVIVFGEQRETLDVTISRITESAPRWNGLALTGRREELAAELPDLVASLKTIVGQFPAEALVSSSEASFVLPPVVPTLQVQFTTPPVVKPGVRGEVRFRLIGPGNVPLITDQLHTTHTEKLHALLLDPLFQDYHHEHPQPTDIPGEYVFHFTPNHPGPYRMWLDAMPVATGRGEFPVGDLEKIPRPIVKAPAPSSEILSGESGGFRARLELPPGGLSFGNPGVVTVALEDAEGRPLTRIEPLMGAHAHMVGFADDFQTILHIHPMGEMPVAGQLGGPSIRFQMRPLLPGWLRLYFQFKVDGHEHLIPFAVPITVK